MNRRTFLGYVGTTLLAPSLHGVEKATPTVPESTHPFASFDQAISQFMMEKQIPGGALSVVKDKRLVYARGYGWSNQATRESVKNNSLFRIASISKPFTAVAVLKLVEQGKIQLDQRAVDFFTLPPILAPGAKSDPRWKEITICHLLQHTGGWDREKSFDPMFRSGTIAHAANVPAPADAHAIIRYMLGQPLDFTPGTRYAYSNFGYCLLGRIIEKVTGQTYDAFVKQNVLSPIGIRNMRLGRTVQQLPNEVVYYDKGAMRSSVFPDVKNKIASPYGGFYLEAMDSHGGWIASAVDLARFAAALHDPNSCPLLKSETMKTMHAPPPAPVSRNADGQLEASYYACGWSVRPKGKDKANVWHNGKLDGTSTLLVRRWDGVSWAALFNSRVENSIEIDASVNRAADAVKTWPTEDLFAAFA